MIALTDHFRRDDRNRHSEWLRQRQWFIKARQDHQRKEDIADKLEENFLSLATEAVIATEVQIQEFEARLDLYETRLKVYDARLEAYETAVMRALIENGEQLELIEKQMAANDAEIEKLLSQAYIHEDGRRLFKSENGSFVIDEHKNHVGKDEVDYDLVVGPTAETYSIKHAEKQNLAERYKIQTEEGRELLRVQGQLDDAKEKSRQFGGNLDAARSRIEEGDMTVDEIEGFDADLGSGFPPDLPTLPASAAKYLSGIDQSAEAPKLKSDFAGNAAIAKTAPDIDLTQAVRVSNSDLAL